MEPAWRIELLGQLRLTCGERVITHFRSQKTAALLAYLAYHRGRAHPRAVLADVFWPDSDPESARHNLNVALSWLREQSTAAGCSDGLLISDRVAVGVEPAHVTTDVAEFEAALDAAGVNLADRPNDLATALRLYSGPLLPGFYDTWILPERQRLDERYFRAHRQFIALQEESGELDAAIESALRGVAIDPLREDAHHDLIRLYLLADRPHDARRQYAELERILRTELDAEPDARTRGLVAAPPPALRHSPALQTFHPHVYSSPGGAVPLDSSIYVARPVDTTFMAALERRDSLVLVKGPRQVGKSSLLARGLHAVRRAEARVIHTDIEALNSVHLEDANSLLLALARSVAEQLELGEAPERHWDIARGPNPSFQRFLRREVFVQVDAPLVWGLDGVDRLFGHAWGAEVFGLMRSWHNERALDPAGPWSRFTLAITYATEAHLFITDLNKSPFNVGTRLALDDFGREELSDLNRRYGSPLRGESEMSRLHDLLGGHPYLVHLGLHTMATQTVDLARLEREADGDDGIFGDHLQRLDAALARDSALCEAVLGVIEGTACPGARTFYRLRSAGVLTGDAPDQARLRCGLYARYLGRSLRQS